VVIVKRSDDDSQERERTQARERDSYKSPETDLESLFEQSESDGPETVTDGGVSPRQSLFETTSDIERTRTDRYRRLFDEYVMAPGRILWNDWRAKFGFLLSSMFVIIGLISWISTSRWWILSDVTIVQQTYADDGEVLVGPFDSAHMTDFYGIPIWEHPLGTDAMGRDVFNQLVHATPAMLEMMFAGAVFSIVLATFWGVFSGYKGGSVDGTMMAIADIVMTIPGLPLVVVLAAIIEPSSAWLIGIILVVNAWAGFARSLRSEVLKLRQESYVEASRTIGISMPAIVTKDVLPNVMPLIVVNFVTTARNVIMASVGLYFLGLLPHTGLNWGVMMNSAYGQGGIYMSDMFHWFYAPMVTIVLLSLGLLLLGQGLDRIFNPRIRARHSESTTDEGSTDESTDDVSTADRHQQGGL